MNKYPQSCHYWNFKNFILASLFILVSALNAISGQSLNGVCLIPSCAERSRRAMLVSSCWSKARPEPGTRKPTFILVTEEEKILSIICFVSFLNLSAGKQETLLCYLDLPPGRESCGFASARCRAVACEDAAPLGPWGRGRPRSAFQQLVNSLVSRDF